MDINSCSEFLIKKSFSISRPNFEGAPDISGGGCSPPPPPSGYGPDSDAANELGYDSENRLWAISI